MIYYHNILLFVNKIFRYIVVDGFDQRTVDCDSQFFTDHETRSEKGFSHQPVDS
jgi:hypothetical protein